MYVPQLHGAVFEHYILYYRINILLYIHVDNTSHVAYSGKNEEDLWFHHKHKLLV